MTMSGYEWDPSDYDPSEPTESIDWRMGGPGDEDWERHNSQLLGEWLRFYERAAEFVAAQCSKRRVRSAPRGWLEAQRERFRGELARWHGGQTEPDTRWIAEYRKRLLARWGEGHVEEFDRKWSQHDARYAPVGVDFKQRQAGDRT